MISKLKQIKKEYENGGVSYVQKRDGYTLIVFKNGIREIKIDK